MKKRILSLLLALSVMMSLGLTAFAVSEAGGTVTFNGTTLITIFSDTAFVGAAKALQPGDEAEIEIQLVNSSSTETEWWMKNTILKNFLTSEKGGAYTYKLSFFAANGTETVIYESNRVGGNLSATQSSNGLKDINAALKDYVFLGKLDAGQTGKLKLYIMLDGETQGNVYMGSLAKLELRFAAALPADKIVKTGDETKVMPYLAASAISGMVLLGLAFMSLDKNRKKQRGESR